MGRLVIYGAGGFGREVARLALHTAAGQMEVVYASDDESQIGTRLSGLRVIASTTILQDDICTIAVNDPATRRTLVDRCPAFVTLIAPMAVVYAGVQIAAGGIVSDFCSVTADAATKIGAHCHINTHSTVGHDCTVGDFVTIGPNVSVNGNVIVEDGVYIGCGARIRNGTDARPLTIGRGAIIGMGAIVTKDVPPGVTMVGNPAQPIQRKPLHIAA